MSNLHTYERYQRQIQLKEFGEAGQQKLLQAKVLVIGAGGLGCPVLQYLTAAGVGTISIVDDDLVALHNLHRQILFTVNDIGSNKATTAKEKLALLNPDITIQAHTQRLTVANALELIQQYDIIIDGTDNFATRYLINDACVLLKKPLVFGAISKFEGQVAILNSTTNEQSVNYRDLFPQPPKDGEVGNCAETGVLGVLPGIIGTMMANETIKWITSIGKPLINQILCYNSLNNESYTISLTAKEVTKSLIPSTKEAFKQMDYAWLCANDTTGIMEMNAEAFEKWIDADDVAIIDVREKGELPMVTEFKVTSIPLSQLMHNIPSIEANTIITFCQSGKRSIQAAKYFMNVYGNTKKIISLQGGIIAWKQNKKIKVS
jgi:sulfur-carrier protein adenylyltransferase/sulfurtransferase